MPCLEIVMPRTSRQARAELAAAVTDAFTEITGFASETFGVYFREYGDFEASCGGVLWYADSQAHPFLHFILYCPRIARSQKQALVAEFSERFTSVLNRPGWSPVIHISEHPYDNVGINGKILSDTYEECANRPFYYRLENT